MADKVNRGKAPEIVSPQNDVTYFVRSSVAKPEPIAFKAVSDADVSELYWFVGEDFVGMAPRNKAILWTPRPGRLLIRAIDDNGRSATQTLFVSQIR